MNTTLAIPVWDDRVATTFDFARGLLVVEADGEREVSRREVRLDEEPIERKARRIRDLAVQVVVCGAISRPLAGLISQAGVRVYPLVAGQVDEVVAAYLCDRLSDPRFLQPGCSPGARRRWRRREGSCGGNRKWREVNSSLENVRET